MINNTQT